MAKILANNMESRFSISVCQNDAYMSPVYKCVRVHVSCVVHTCMYARSCCRRRAGGR